MVTYMFRLSRYKDPYEPTNQPTNQYNGIECFVLYFRDSMLCEVAGLDSRRGSWYEGCCCSVLHHLVRGHRNPPQGAHRSDRNDRDGKLGKI